MLLFDLFQPERLDPATAANKYDVRSDVWAFGITLVELATLKYPYREPGTMFERLREIVECEYIETL